MAEYIDLTSRMNPLSRGKNVFVGSDNDNDSGTIYDGLVNHLGWWIIVRRTISGTDSSYRYAVGREDYETNWTNRTTLGYDYWYNAAGAIE